MNNEQQSEQQKAIRRFLLGVFLLHYYVQSLFLNLLEMHFSFFSYFIYTWGDDNTYLFCYSGKSKSLLWAVFIGGIFYAFFNPYYRRIIFAFC